jgi:hypothetical protein
MPKGLFISNSESSVSALMPKFTAIIFSFDQKAENIIVRLPGKPFHLCKIFASNVIEPSQVKTVKTLSWLLALRTNISPVQKVLPRTNP